jgi:transposase InsO family protein
MDSERDRPVAPNRLERNFPPARPDPLWSADIAHTSTTEGWLYLAAAMDLYTRMIIGWSAAVRMTRDEARRDTFEYIEGFHNRSRRHCALGYVSPPARHAAWQNQQETAA